MSGTPELPFIILTSPRNGSILLQFVQTKLFSVRLFLPVKLLFSVLNYSFLHTLASVRARERLRGRATYVARDQTKNLQGWTSVSYWLPSVKCTVCSSDRNHYRSNTSRSLFCFKYYPNSKCDFPIFVQLFLQFNANKNINTTKLSKETLLLPLYHFTYGRSFKLKRLFNGQISF